MSFYVDRARAKQHTASRDLRYFRYPRSTAEEPTSKPDSSGCFGKGRWCSAAPHGILVILLLFMVLNGFGCGHSARAIYIPATCLLILY